MSFIGHLLRTKILSLRIPTMEIMEDLLFECWALLEQARRDSDTSSFTSDSFLLF